MKTFSKKVFLTSLLVTASLSFAKLSEEAISDVYSTQLEGAAKYLEYHFIFQPNNTLQAAQTNLTVKLGAIAATALLLATKTPQGKSFLITKNADGKDFTELDNPTLIASGMLCIAGGYAYYCKFESNIKLETLVNFLKNWSYHRQFLPEDFITVFDELAAYQADGKKFSNNQVNEIFELVLHYVEHSFEKRYPKEKKSQDLLSSVKTITEIGKNFAPAK